MRSTAPGATLPAQSSDFFSHGLELCRPDADTPIERKAAIIELTAGSAHFTVLSRGDPLDLPVS